MRKGFTLTFSQPARLSICALLAALGLISAPTEAQQSSPYRDGFPKFQSFDPDRTNNVDYSDTVVTLLQRNTSFTDPAVYVLPGVDWTYSNNSATSPKITAARDIDKIPGENRYIITDSLAKRVYIITIDGTTQFKNKEIGIDGPAPGPKFDLVLDKPVDAYWYKQPNDKEKIVITDQGRHRVFQVDVSSDTVDWSYGGTSGNAANQLSSPSDAVTLNNGQQALICDTGNRRVILINTAAKDTAKSFTVLSFSGKPGTVRLKSPVDIELDPSSNENVFLVTDQEDNRVMLVDRRNSQIVWSFGTGQKANTDSTLDSPTDADVIANTDGNILICDGGNNKGVIEVDRISMRDIKYRFPITAQQKISLQNLRDADRITDSGPDLNKTLVVAADPNDQSVNRSVLPFRLAYSSKEFIDPAAVYEFPEGFNADFDNLSFPTSSADKPPGTQIRLQMRSAKVKSDVSTAPWRGPTSDSDFYTGPTTPINPIHDGDHFFQFRVFLDNDVVPSNPLKPLLTPVLRSVNVTGHYFEANKAGILTSIPIRDLPGRTVTRWGRLIVNRVLPNNLEQRDKVFIDLSIRDEQNTKTLHTLAFSSNASASDTFNLALVEALRGVQALRLQARLTTIDPAATPKLNDWQLDWESTRTTSSNIRFTDQNDKKVEYYRLLSVDDNPQPISTVFLTLDDSNIVALQSTVNLKINALRSRDSEDIRLTSTPLGPYVLRPGYPAFVIHDGDTPRRLGTFEVYNRDTLVVRYEDPTNSLDVSIDSVLIIQTTSGKVAFENSGGSGVDTVAIGDQLFVRVTNETDRSFTLGQDSLEVTLLRANAQTTDTEILKLYEVPNPNNNTIYDTGEFLSRHGILLTKNSSRDGDDSLQVNGGDQVRVDYIDFDGSKAQDFVFVSLDTIPGLFNLLAVNKAFDFFVAPNPFHAKRHNSFRIAVVARTVNMDVQRLEIYNFAGERVRSMSSQELPFSSQIQRNNQALSRENGLWWDFKTDDGSSVAPGTYWARLEVLVTDPTGRTQKTTALRKFVIVR